VRRGVGSDGRGKAQRLGFQEGKSTIFVGGGGGGIAFIFRPGGQNRTLRPVSSTDNMTIKRRTTGFGLKRPGDGVAASFFKGDFGLLTRTIGVTIYCYVINFIVTR
jgi:hypothetical protein